MKALVIGSGAREHALCWSLSRSNLVKEVICAPGNPGISQVARCAPVKVGAVSELVALAQKESVDLTVVGPEYPLSLGVVDAFQTAGLRIFGPSQAAAQMESSKSFAKEIMVGAGVPTAQAKSFDSRSGLEAELAGRQGPVVLKADGLAAGKGVIVCADSAEAMVGVATLYDSIKPKRVLVEDFLEGREASYIAAVFGSTVVPLAGSHDYKRIWDGNRGPNTGGMGSISPSQYLSPELEARVSEEIIRPVVEELARREIFFAGFLYAGLMISPNGDPSVLEFNTRLGDPEAQVILRRLDSDLFTLLMDMMEEKEPTPPTWRKEAAACVVMASEGYPQQPRKGDEIKGIEAAEKGDEELVVFHAGTSNDSAGNLVTAGGRVLSVTCCASEESLALRRCYEAVEQIKFRGAQWREDIGGDNAANL